MSSYHTMFASDYITRLLGPVSDEHRSEVVEDWASWQTPAGAGESNSDPSNQPSAAEEPARAHAAQSSPRS